MKASIDVPDRIAMSKSFQHELSMVVAMVGEVPDKGFLWNSSTAATSIPCYDSWVNIHAQLTHIEVNSTTRFRSTNADVLEGLRRKQAELVASLLEVAKTKLDEQFSPCVDQWLCEAATDEEDQGDDMGECFSKVNTRNMLNLNDLAKIGCVDVVAQLQNFMSIASSSILEVLAKSASSCITLALGRKVNFTEEPMLSLATVLGKIAGGLPDILGTSGKKLHEHLWGLMGKVVRENLAQHVAPYMDFAGLIDQTPIDVNKMSHFAKFAGGCATQAEVVVEIRSSRSSSRST